MRTILRPLSTLQGIHKVSGAKIKSVQLPDDVYRRMAELAEADHVYVGRLVILFVNEGMGGRVKVQAGSAGGSLAKPERVLSEVSDVPREA
jgi:hypothetical protein